MTSARTNEERFISACEKVGEAEVRHRFNAGRYDGRKVEWASKWLEMIQDGKSDATKAAESNRLVSPPASGRYVQIAMIVTFVILAAAVGVVLLSW